MMERKIRLVILFSMLVTIAFTSTHILTVSATDESAITDLLREYYNAFNAHDVNRELATIVNDATPPPPPQTIVCGDPSSPYVGKTAIAGQLNYIFGDPTLRLGPPIYVTKLSIVGSTATVNTRYTGYYGGGSGAILETLTLTKQNGQWLITEINVCFGEGEGGWVLEYASPVGGYVTPTNKLGILAPYLALAGFAVVATVVVVKARKA